MRIKGHGILAVKLLGTPPLIRAATSRVWLGRVDRRWDRVLPPTSEFVLFFS